MSLSIRRAARATALRVHRFHAAQLTPHLWPRTVAELETLANDGSLHYAERGGELVGACYVKDETPTDPAEFGGVCVHPHARGAIGRASVAYALGAVAIALYLATNMPAAGTKLIAHVHCRNKAPRKLLERLGFELVSSVTVPAHQVPPSMDLESDGTMIGDVFEFDYRKLAAMADWLEVELREDAFEFDLVALGWPAVLTAIRAIAGGFRRS